MAFSTSSSSLSANFSYSENQTYESLRVAESLKNLPVLTVAFKEGKTFWSGVREITRIAKPQTEEVWLRWSEGKTCREITHAVQDARENGRDLPRKRTGGLPNLVTRIIFSLTLEDQELVERAFAKMGAEMKKLLDLPERPSSQEVLVYLARLILETAPGTPLLGRTGKECTPYHLLYRVCPECKEARLKTRHGEIQVPLEHAERLKQGGAEVVRIRPEEELPSGSEEKRRPIDRKNTASLVRKVIHRDGLSCKNCGSKFGLQADHREERAKGGRTELANSDCLCQACHALKTGGHLIPRKDENGDTVYQRRADFRRKELAEEEKSLDAIRAPLADSTRVESSGPALPGTGKEAGPAAGSAKLLEESVAELRKVGVWEKEARRRVIGALERFKAAGKFPRTQFELLQVAAAYY